MTPPFDALVIGAGPAGSTAALLLANAGWRVGIVEKAVFPRRKVCGEFISATTWPLLRAMGAGDALLPAAGPAVRRVGVFAGDGSVTSRLPHPDAAGHSAAPGRAIERAHLDACLLERAVRAGARLFQPWRLAAFSEDHAGAACTLEERGTNRTKVLRARVVIAAHGAWEGGPLPTQRQKIGARLEFLEKASQAVGPFAKNSSLAPISRLAATFPMFRSDLLGFKAHFRDASLPADLMPLIAFPGGYGGLVNTGNGLLSMSCCVRRDALDALRRRWPKLRAGDALRAHIEASCAGAAQVLAGATIDGTWHAAGPLRTGIRGFGSGRIVAIGNAAAEAHPIVAEGISMAIQSAHLACAALAAARGEDALPPAAFDAARVEYARAWRRNFSLRLHAAALFAHVFMRPVTASLAMRVLRVMPALLTQGAHWSGKDSAFAAIASAPFPEGRR